MAMKVDRNMAKYRVFVLLCLVIVTSTPSVMGLDDDEKDAINLGEIVISATRTASSLNNVSASSSVVPERQIKSSTATDLGHLLATTGLLEILDYGPGGISAPSIRGSSREQVLVLVDGERINDSRSGGVDLNNVPIANAKRIEIVRGGQSAMYGADAVGGIINIITRQPTGTKARAWSALGAYDAVSYGLEASKQIKTVSGLVSFSRSDSESDFPFEDKFGRELVRQNASYMKRDVFGRLNWNISGSANLRLSGDHNYSDKGDPGLVGSYAPDAVKTDRSNGLKADLEHSLTEGMMYKLSGYRRDATLRYINPQEPYPVDDTHKTASMGGELQVYLLQNTSVPLVWGISVRNEAITSSAVGDRERETYSGYIQQELSKDLGGSFLHLNRLTIFPAFRWDHYSDFEAGLSPKLGFLASFGEHGAASVKANFGKSYRAPVMNDLYWPSDAFAVGNPDLEPERATNMDLGLHLHVSEPSVLPRLSMIRCGVSYFWNSFRDRIIWNPGEAGKWSPQNLSEANSTGMEIETRVYTAFWNVPDLLSLGMNYTLLIAEDMLGRQLTYRPRHSLGYTFRVGTDRIWGQIQGLYRSRRYYTVQNTKWLDPFMKHDLQLGMERRLWSNASLGIVLEVKNIFDKRYQLVADYPLPGREWNIRTSIGMGGE